MSPNTLLLGEVVPAEDAGIEQQIQEGLSVCTEEQKLSILQTIRLFTQRI